MKINLKATGIELTPAISDYAHKKVSILSKYLPQDESTYVAHVEIGRTTEHHKEGKVYKAEIHLTGGGLDTYAATTAEDIYAAIDLVENEAARALLSQKGKRIRILRKGERIVKNMMKGYWWPRK